MIFNERIKAVVNDYLEKEKMLGSKLQLIDDSIKTISEIVSLRTDLEQKKTSLENDKKIVASIENEQYKDLSEKVNEVTADIEKKSQNKEQYSDFFAQLTELCLSVNLEKNTDEYGQRLAEIINHIDTIDEITRINNEQGTNYQTTLKSFPDTDKLLEAKKIELASLKQEIVDYFTSIGSTPDSIADVDRATSNIATVTNEIAELNKKIQVKREHLQKLNEQTADIIEIVQQCEQIINTRLEAINKDLDITNDNVEQISFKYEFHQEKYRDRLNQDFRNHFQL